MPTEGPLCDSKRVLPDLTDVPVVFHSLPLYPCRCGIFITGLWDIYYRIFITGFYRCLSVHRREGACVVAGGHAWLPGGMHGCRGVCVVVGGVHGCWGACVVARVCVWLLGVCMVAGGHGWLLGGMHGCWGACIVAGGHAWLLGGMHGCQGACMVAGGMHGCRGHAWLLGGCA